MSLLSTQLHTATGRVLRARLDAPTYVLLVLAVTHAGVLVAQEGASTRQSAVQQAFSIADVLSPPFPTDLVAAPMGGRLAWVEDDRGSRNIWIAEPVGDGSYRARPLTRYTGDDGIEIGELTWRLDGQGLVYRRGGAVNVAHLDGTGSPEPMVRDRGTDASLAWSPDGARLAFVSDRGDHSLIGLYDRGANSLRWLSAGVDQDFDPQWSPP